MFEGLKFSFVNNTKFFSAVIHKGKILRHFEIFQIYNDIYNEFFTQHNLRTDKTSSQVLFSLSRKSFGRVFTIDINCKRAEQINNQDLERFPIRQNILLDLFKCKWNARHFPEQPETFRGIPVFLFQAVGTEIPFPFAQFCLIRPSAGAWNLSRHFQCFPESVVYGQSQFFFSFLIVTLKMAIASVEAK